MTNFGRATGNGLRVLDHLFESPYVNVAIVKLITGSRYPAANNLVNAWSNRESFVR